MRKSFYIDGSKKMSIDIRDMPIDYYVTSSLPGYIPSEIENPEEGRTIFDREEEIVKVFHGGAWLELTGTQGI